jgi:cytidylate kinase
MTDDRRGPVVAIDGPASSGKSSVGARAAAELGYRFVDTGLLYRALTWLALREAAPVDDGPAVAALARRVTLAAGDDGRMDAVLVDGADVTEHVRDAAVERHVSEVARQPEVRAALLERQRALAADGAIVVAGRDIGTVVLPDADVKVFLEASAEERARRRAEQRGIAADSAAAAAILADLRARDEIDRNRPTAPLRAAEDAVRVVTDGNQLEDTVEAVVDVVRRATQLADAERAAAADAAAAVAVPRSTPRTARPDEQPLADHVTPFIALTNLVGRVITRSVAHLKVEGLEEPLDIDGPLIVVANHASNADGVLLACWMTRALGRRVYLLGKQEALEWPVLGWALSHLAVVGVRRGVADLDAFRAARRVLDEGHVLGVFPEGTRSPDGKLQEAKEGIAILALRSGAPILPVGIAGTHRFWPRGQKLFRPGVGHLRMRVGRPFRLEPASGRDRKAAQREATRQIMTRIAELLPPSQRGVYADDVERAGRR